MNSLAKLARLGLRLEETRIDTSTKATAPENYHRRMKVSVSGGVSTSHVVVAEKRRCSRVSAIIRLCNPDGGSVNAARDTKRAGASTLEKFHRYQPRNHYFRHPTFHFRLYSRVCSVGQRTVAITFTAQWKEAIATITMLLMPLIGSFFLNTSYNSFADVYIPFCFNQLETTDRCLPLTCLLSLWR